MCDFFQEKVLGGVMIKKLDKPSYGAVLELIFILIVLG